MEQVQKGRQNPLGTEPIGRLLPKFAVPAVISMLVSALYNIVDQIFIGQGVGMYGNAATNVAFPLTTLATALGLLLGIGGASNFNLEMGRGNKEKAEKIAGTSFGSLMISGIVICVVVRLFLKPLILVFGATPEVMDHAMDYVGITSFGMPFYILTTGGNHMIRADGSPTYSMGTMVSGALVNTVLDPLFIFGFHMGIAGRPGRRSSGRSYRRSLSSPICPGLGRSVSRSKDSCPGGSACWRSRPWGRPAVLTSWR